MFRGVGVKIQHAEIVKISLCGNKSKGMILNATERFRCHSLASGQARCQRFASGRFRCFLNLAGLCGQAGCWYKEMLLLFKKIGSGGNKVRKVLYIDIEKTKGMIGGIPQWQIYGLDYFKRHNSDH